MLVLNTNKQSESTTNDVFDYVKYPDFSQFLGFFPAPTSSVQQAYMKNGDVVPGDGTYPTALSVNGTVVNFTFLQNRESNLFGTPNSGDIGYYQGIAICRFGTSGATHTHTIRYGALGQLEAGNVVGKKINRFGIIMRANNTYMTENSAVLKVGLLHIDGTISYLPDIDIIACTYPANQNVRHMISVETAGLTSLAGDRIIVDLTINATSNNSNGYSYLGAGYLGSTTYAPLNNNAIAPAPIQISIE